MKRLICVLTVMVTACGSSSSPAASRSPSSGAAPSTSSATSGTASSSPAPLAAGYAAIEQFHGDGTYTVTLVDDTGKVVAAANAAGRSSEYPRIGPNVSSSNRLVYYLDGDSAVRSLAPDGTTALVANLPASNGTEAVFAVSPDDSRIAVALLTYGAFPASPPPGPEQVDYKGMQLYVSDIGGGNRVNIYSSATVAEWPVGWHRSDLVIAVSQPMIPGLGRDPYPYFAFNGYHVADAQTGARVAALCAVNEGSADGMPTPDGVLCDRYGGAIYVAGWNGAESLFQQLPNDDACFALEPGAQHVACLGDSSMVAAGGARTQLPGTPVGFIDAGHLLLSSTAGQAQILLYDVASAASRTVLTGQSQAGTPAFSGLGFMAARIPAAL